MTLTITPKKGVNLKLMEITLPLIPAHLNWVEAQLEKASDLLYKQSGGNFNAFLLVAKARQMLLFNGNIKMDDDDQNTPLPDVNLPDLEIPEEEVEEEVSDDTSTTVANLIARGEAHIKEMKEQFKQNQEKPRLEASERVESETTSSASVKDSIAHRVKEHPRSEAFNKALKKSQEEEEEEEDKE